MNGFRMATIALLALGAAACNASVVPPSAHGSPAESTMLPLGTDATTAHPSLDVEPTASPSPAVGVESPTIVPSLRDLSLQCTGDMVATVIDYADEAAGTTNILSATRDLQGVRPTDVVVVTGTATWVVREGSAIWTGNWFRGSSGFLLGGFSACGNAGIATTY